MVQRHSVLLAAIYQKPYLRSGWSESSRGAWGPISLMVDLSIYLRLLAYTGVFARQGVVGTRHGGWGTQYMGRWCRR